ncbi:MAG TPA: hypothetical protein VGC78_12940 [Gaiellaceae bacterium]
MLAAPLWRLFDTATAYHLVQVENAFIASLAALPVYAVAKRLGLTSGWAIGAATYAVALPSLVLVAYTMSDALGYTLALATLAAALSSLETPTKRRQLVFLALATLASLTRVEYFALVPAYAVAAVVVDRRAALRRHTVAIAALAPAAAVVLLAAFGYYAQGVQDTRIDFNYVKWLAIQPYLLALETGVAIVPGAIAGLLTARGRRSVSFAVLSASFAGLVIAQATAHAADSLEFKERYLFVLLPLVALAFALYARDSGRGRRIVIGVACVLFVAIARIPISSYDAASFKSDSQFLLGVGDLESSLGVANTALLVAGAGAFGVVVAFVAALRGRLWVPAAVALAAAMLLTFQASRVDLTGTRHIRESFRGSLTWVDDAAVGRVTAVATPHSPASDLISQLWWNQSIQREAVLDDGAPTDAFSFQRVHPTVTGELDEIHGAFLFDDYGTTALFANATRVARRSNFTLWTARGTPRLRALIEGRFSDGWLTDKGRIRAWGDPGDRSVRVAFVLSLPPDLTVGPKLGLGPASVVVAPGRSVAVTCVFGTSHVDIPFSTNRFVLREGTTFRRLSVRLGHLQVTRSRSTATATGCTSRPDGRSA